MSFPTGRRASVSATEEERSSLARLRDAYAADLLSLDELEANIESVLRGGRILTALPPRDPGKAGSW
jgi:hypothetical protein